MDKPSHKRITILHNLHYDINTMSQLSRLGERLASSIFPISQRTFAELWGLSPVSVGRYIKGEQSPRIKDLARFSELTNTDLLWLIAGEHYAQKRWLKSNQFIKLCIDDTMAPTLSSNTPVALETIDQNTPMSNGVYALKNTQGYTFRRLQWDEEKQGFWLHCDNKKFETQFCQAPTIIGKVTSALTPIT